MTECSRLRKFGTDTGRERVESIDEGGLVILRWRVWRRSPDGKWHQSRWNVPQAAPQAERGKAGA